MKYTAILAVGLLSTALDASASCMADGTRTQSVWLSSEGKQLERWEPVPGQIHQVKLPGGFIAGIQIDPTTPEKYRELLTRVRSFDEVVKISIFDMNEVTPKPLSTTWGGANSKQGFGPHGGANGVPALGDQIELWLHKPVCVTPETIATSAR
jgi:hypothetical protein